MRRPSSSRARRCSRVCAALGRRGRAGSSRVRTGWRMTWCLASREDVAVALEHELRDADDVRDRGRPPGEPPRAQAAEQRARRARRAVLPQQRHARAEQVVVVERVHDGEPVPARRPPTRPSRCRAGCPCARPRAARADERRSDRGRRSRHEVARAVPRRGAPRARPPVGPVQRVVDATGRRAAGNAARTETAWPRRRAARAEVGRRSAPRRRRVVSAPCALTSRTRSGYLEPDRARTARTAARAVAGHE